MKITFMGAGSTVFVRNVLGDCMCSEALRDSEFALYDIDGERLHESAAILQKMQHTLGGHGKPQERAARREFRGERDSGGAV